MHHCWLSRKWSPIPCHAKFNVRPDIPNSEELDFKSSMTLNQLPSFWYKIMAKSLIKKQYSQGSN